MRAKEMESTEKRKEVRGLSHAYNWKDDLKTCIDVSSEKLGHNGKMYVPQFKLS